MVLCNYVGVCDLYGNELVVIEVVVVDEIVVVVDLVKGKLIVMLVVVVCGFGVFDDGLIVW